MYRFAAMVSLVVSCFVLTLDGPAPAREEKPQKSPLKFNAFMDHVKAAAFDEYKKLEGARVESEDAFKEMQKFIANRYKDYPVKHTFLSTQGHAIDCVPINQQPALRNPRLAGHRVRLTPTPPPELKAKGDKAAPGATAVARMLTPESEKDAAGNVMAAPDGTIPIRRVTLADLVRFKTLKEFLQKDPHGSGNPLAKPAAPDPHRYAVGVQNVANIGGTSWLNIWDPTPTQDEFSLSQVWFVAGDPVQTVECGWQVYPQKYGHGKPVLFIYWTADGYNQTGNYNLDAPAFVQTNSNFVIGGAWNTISTTGGTQYGFQVSWFRDPNDHNWWLWIQGGGVNTAIGYYPSTLFGTGPMATGSATCEFGGEVTGTASGQMGSGAVASTGFGKAAFQRNVGYYATAAASFEATLTPIEQTPQCYTIDIHNQSGTSWGSYFFFGGPKCP
jgi:hypothetical protein